MTDLQKTESFIQSLLGKMGYEDFQIETDEKNGDIVAEIKGTKNENVIGYRGETLDAIQYLTSIVVNNASAGRHKRVVVDSENYRAKREKSLEQLAKNLEQKVKRTQRAEKLEPMNPFERRIIHTTLQDSAFVTTESEGSEPNRYVVVSPTLSFGATDKRKTLNFVYRSEKKKRR